MDSPFTRVKHIVKLEYNCKDLSSFISHSFLWPLTFTIFLHRLRSSIFIAVPLCLRMLLKYNVTAALQVSISGYAASGGGRGIERLDVSLDGGKTWMEASRFQKSDIPYTADTNGNGDKWGWVLFEVTTEIQQSTEIIAKAWS
ncbi:hypothetical protein RYX36_037185 [Vicia faba]